MAEPLSTNTVQLPRPNPPPGNGQRHPSGVVEIASESSLSRDLLKPPGSFQEALSWTHININRKTVDALKKAMAILALHDSDEEFNYKDTELTNLLTILPSIGGYNRSQAIQSDVKIVSPEALGVDLDKHETESLKKAQKEKEEREQNRGRNQ
jgi:hypothetical protein